LPGDERERATAFGEQDMAPEAYEEAVDLHAELGRIGEALTLAEQAKGRILLESIRTAHGRTTKAMTVEETRDEQRLESELTILNLRLTDGDGSEGTALRERLARVRDEYSTLQSSLYARHPRLKAQRGEVTVASLAQMADALPVDGAFVEYAVGENRTHAFVVTRGAGGGALLRSRMLPIGRRALEEKIAALRRQLAARNLAQRNDARD